MRGPLLVQNQIGWSELNFNSLGLCSREGKGQLELASEGGMQREGTAAEVKIIKIWLI